MNFTSCWMEPWAPSPFSPWVGNHLSHACLSRQPQSPPAPFALPAILAPFKDAFDATLSCVLPPHSHHNLTFKTTVDLVKIDAPMYPSANWRIRLWARGWMIC
ncbi:hypothetical protein DSO57_1038389 [Entomophthora muscae]|uniref:Uncharacterized protein n=1 Tax=Entomophthora muscae TaxID=34485 RepID=A0ACC2RDE2_9FUNG|nr:hypothetical protein DSO57_1038389 [Entomophthora muscae]